MDGRRRLHRTPQRMVDRHRHHTRPPRLAIIQEQTSPRDMPDMPSPRRMRHLHQAHRTTRHVQLGHLRRPTTRPTQPPLLSCLNDAPSDPGTTSGRPAPHQQHPNQSPPHPAPYAPTTPRRYAPHANANRPQSAASSSAHAASDTTGQPAAAHSPQQPSTAPRPAHAPGSP